MKWLLLALLCAPPAMAQEEHSSPAHADEKRESTVVGPTEGDHYEAGPDVEAHASRAPDAAPGEVHFLRDVLIHRRNLQLAIEAGDKTGAQAELNSLAKLNASVPEGRIDPDGNFDDPSHGTRQLLASVLKIYPSKVAALPDGPPRSQKADAEKIQGLAKALGGNEGAATGELQKKIAVIVDANASPAVRSETAKDAANKAGPDGKALIEVATEETANAGHAGHQEDEPPASSRDTQEESQVAASADRIAGQTSGRLRETALGVAGRHYLRAGQPQQAAEDFRRILETDPGNMPAREGHALALDQQGQRREAASEARKILEADPNSEVAHMVLGHGDELGKSSGVVQKVSKLVGGLWSGAAVQKIAEQPQARAAVGAHSLGEGPNERAAGELDALPSAARAKFIQSQPAEPSIAFTPLLPAPSMAHYKEAFGKLQVRDMTGALFEATASINDAPNSAAPWVLRAYIDNRLEPEPNPQGAVSDAGQALHIEPQNAAALREKALGEITQGQFQPALTDLAAAIQIDSKNGTGYLYRAMAQEKLGRASDAVADFNKAASLDPALTPFANQALARLGGTKFAERPPSSNSRNRKLLRGGMIALALALILAGMLSTEMGRKLITQRAVFGTKGEASFGRTVGPSRALSEGEVIGGNYRVVRELGRGGMGIVYEAMDLALQRKVAVKQLQRTETATAEDLERFLREARLVAKLKNPRLVEIYSVINEGDLFLVFEHMDGKSLDHVLGSRQRLSLSEVHQALADVGAAIDYAHAQNVIHRDLKPANVMVERDGRCKVMDFGIAHQSQAATFMTQTMASGTPPYMAPEQAFGSVSKASDLYAMGVMAYEMATGRRPFTGPDYVEQKLQRRFDSVTSRQLPAALDAFFQKALDPDPTKRFASAAELLQGFRAACATQPV